MAAFVTGPVVALRASTFAPSASSVSTAARPRAARWTMAKSASVPFLDTPAKLAGADIPGNYEFDPLGFSDYYDLNFLREAEIKHGRICMLAILGWVFPEAIVHLPNAAYAETNPLRAVTSVGFLPMAQIFLLCVVLEGISYNKSRKGYENPGDYGWDAFGLAVKDGAKNHYRNAEIKNGRLAMIAIGGAIHHSLITGQGLLEQIYAGNWLGGSRPF